MTDRLPLEAQIALQYKVRELSFLERIVRVATSSIDHTTMLRTIIDETTAATGTQVCSLYLWDDAERELVLTATNGLSQSGVGTVRLGLGEGVTGWVAAQRTALAVPDVRLESRFTWVPGLDQERFLSMLSVPIVSRDRVVGVMNVQTVDTHEFSREEVQFVSAIAGQLAGIIELSRLHEKVAKQLELEREAVATLTALNRSKSDLMSMLSHDFRGPLSIAKSYLYGLLGALGGAERAACEEIDAELQSLEKMVDNVLLSLELEAQHTVLLDVEALALNELVADQIRRIQYASPDHAIRVVADVEIVVRADPAKIRAVIVNLLGNAVKYSPAGGEIEVRIMRLAEEVEVSVTDRGIGIDEREIESLFERYGRGDRALEHGISGHGLGLFICRSIVEAHGGRIYARGESSGSRFAFTLPLPG
jgi:signal transduction histidine kinase